MELKGVRSAPIITMLYVHGLFCPAGSGRSAASVSSPHCPRATDISPRVRLDLPSGPKLRRRGSCSCTGQQLDGGSFAVSQGPCLKSQTVPGWHPSWTCGLDEDVIAEYVVVELHWQSRGVLSAAMQTKTFRSADLVCGSIHRSVRTDHTCLSATLELTRASPSKITC